MITAKNLLFSTLIGLQAEIVNSSQRKLIGLKGTIIDETKNMIEIESGGRAVKVPKNSSIFRIIAEDGEAVDVRGSDISFRPHERPKKV
jgi:ribonuclease P protein subunit POP4